METKMKNIHMNRISKESMMQLTIDEDINISEIKPDVDKILNASLLASQLQTRALDEKLEINGKLEYSILYISKDERKRVECIMGNIDLSEHMNLEGAAGLSNVKCKIVIEDTSVKMINSRKLSLKAILLIKASGEEMYDEEIMEDIEGNDVEKLKRKLELSHLVVNTNDTIRIKTEITVPNGKPNIDEILYKHFDIRNPGVRCVDNGINISGEMKAFALYYGNGNSMVASIESSIPYNNTLEINGINDGMIACVQYNLGFVDLELKEDEDGENRILLIDAVLELDIKAYEDRENEIVCDIYSPLSNTKLEADNVTFDKILLKNYSKCRINKNIAINTQGSKIMQICYAQCMPKVEETNICDGNIEVLGIVNLKLIYIKDNDSEPLGVLEQNIPFTHMIETNDVGKNVIYSVEAFMEQISTNVLSQEEIEIKLSVGLDCLIKEHICENIIRHVEFEKIDSDMLMNKAPIIGCIVREGETLWDIAKKYRTSMETIKKINHLQNEKIEKGKKLLIISRPQY